jgi:polyhydroxyalkanoate synthase subunit PhaC
MTKAPEAAGAALDVLLMEASDDTPARFVRPTAAASVAAGLARHPNRAARRVGHLGSELARVAGGRSEIRPAKRDRRFADPAWSRAGCSGASCRATCSPARRSTG